jgi:hypothetical protein
LLFLATLIAAVIAPVAANADAPFLWSAPVPVVAPGTFLSGVACNTTPLCVAVDHKGDVVHSLTSMAEPGSWVVQNPSGVELAAVSCASQVFCVAVARDDSVLYSENAAAPTPSWTVEEHVDHSGSPLTAVSCVSSSFCVAADEAGHILNSRNPTGGSVAWTGEPVDELGRTGKSVPIWGLACLAETLCVASDGAGRILTSKNPTAGKSGWQIRSVEANVTIWAVSCPSAGLCVAVDGGGNVLTSTDPAAEAWTPDYRIDTHQLTAVSCVLPSTCVTTDEAGNVVTSSAAGAAGGAWSVTSVDGGGHQLTGVSCESAQRCVAVDNVGDVLIGTQAPRRTLSVSGEGAGSGIITGAGISCPVACSSSELNGADVVLTASPSAASTFVGWSGACTGTGACDIAMNSNEGVAANFAVKPSAGGPPPGGTGSAGGSSANATSTAKAASVTVAGWIIALPTGVGMPLRCWAKAGTCPPATLTLSIVETLRGKRVIAVAPGHGRLRKKRVVVGTTTITLNAGQTAPVDVTLNRFGRSQLKRLHRLSALLEISSTRGTVFWRQTVGLFQHSKHKYG